MVNCSKEIFTMQLNKFFSFLAMGIALSILTVACNAPTNDAATKAAQTEVAQPDMAKIKA